MPVLAINWSKPSAGPSVPAILRRTVAELQASLEAKEKDMEAKQAELADVQREKRVLAEQARGDHRQLIGELERYKEKVRASAFSW